MNNESNGLGSLDEMVKCCVEVRINGMNFPRYRRCTRVAVTKDEHGKPVCSQHSPASKAMRREKGEAARLRNLRLHLAYLHAKSAAAANDPSSPRDAGNGATQTGGKPND